MKNVLRQMLASYQKYVEIEIIETKQEEWIELKESMSKGQLCK
jgi:hypothetical protein